MFSAFLHDHTKLDAAAGPGKEGVAAQHSCPSRHFPCLWSESLVWFSLSVSLALLSPVSNSWGSLICGFLTKHVKKSHDGSLSNNLMGLSMNQGWLFMSGN